MALHSIKVMMADVVGCGRKFMCLVVRLRRKGYTDILGFMLSHHQFTILLVNCLIWCEVFQIILAAISYPNHAHINIPLNFADM